MSSQANQQEILFLPKDFPAVAGIDNPTNATFQIKGRKLYFPVVTLSTVDDNNFFLEHLK